MATLRNLRSHRRKWRGRHEVALGVALTIPQLAAVSRWPLERTLALAGTARGDTLGAWGDNLRRRFGDDALARVRARVPDEVAAIAPVLGERDRVPVFAQLVLTEAIVDELLAGDMVALGPLLVADSRAGLGRIKLAAMRLAGAGNLVKLGPRAFRDVHERGQHEVTTSGRRAELRFTGNPLFGHPTWRVLQTLATRVLFELVGTRGEVVGEDTSDTAFTAIATWA